MNDENTCECGAWKKEEYELCYDCNQEELKDNGNICECGQYKDEQYDYCYSCNQLNQ